MQIILITIDISGNSDENYSQLKEEHMPGDA